MTTVEIPCVFIQTHQRGCAWTHRGRLLLGTTTEGESSADNLTIFDSGNCGITIRSGTGNSGSIYFSDQTSGGGEYDGLIAYHQGNRFLQFWTAQTERMRIDSSGNVGINQIPTRELSLHSPNNNNSYIHFTNDDTGETSSDGALVGIDGNEDLQINNQESSKNIILRTGGSERMRITSDGYVRIGSTAGGAQPLCIAGSDSSGVNLQFQNSTTGNTGNDGVLIGLSGGEDGQFWNYENNCLLFGTNNNEAFRITNQQQFLVGTTSDSNLNNGGGASERNAKAYIFNTTSTTSERYNLGLIGGSANSTGCTLSLNKTRATTNSHTVVQSGDELGEVRFQVLTAHILLKLQKSEP